MAQSSKLLEVPLSKVSWLLLFLLLLIYFGFGDFFVLFSVYFNSMTKFFYHVNYHFQDCFPIDTIEGKLFYQPSNRCTDIINLPKYWLLYLSWWFVCSFLIVKSHGFSLVFWLLVDETISSTDWNSHVFLSNEHPFFSENVIRDF